MYEEVNTNKFLLSVTSKQLERPASIHSQTTLGLQAAAAPCPPNYNPLTHTSTICNKNLHNQALVMRRKVYIPHNSGYAKFSNAFFVILHFSHLLHIEIYC
jgi:hypothetical protein